MIIKKVAFGDNSEAFVENRITDGLNIIFSDDNNRGKTLVIQGLMYSLGYASLFPSSFSCKDKYFYSEIEVNGEEYHFLRKNNSVIIKNADSVQIYNSIGDMRYFIDRQIFKIPKILKDGREVLVDLSLLYELFFVGQDNRNSSDLISRGRFNKQDFKNMIYDFAGLSGTWCEDVNIDDLKREISSLKVKLKETNRKISILKENPNIAEFALKTQDSDKLDIKIRAINEINKQISDFKRVRQREINRRSKLENLRSELHSLNRELIEGNVKCGSCGSDKILYTNNDLTFEVSNIDVRNGILKSINENISQKNYKINDITIEINTLQDSLQKELADCPTKIEQVIIYREQILESKDYDSESFTLKKQINSLNSQLTVTRESDNNIKVKRNILDEQLVTVMNKIYKEIDRNGNLKFEDIFTKRDAIFSGSEGQEFYFCKLIALCKVLDHNFPIIVDSFRDGELSSAKENKMLDIYKSLGRQVIITSTLKTEEYNQNKYKQIPDINYIDYSTHQDCKILDNSKVMEFNKLISKFPGIVI